MPPCAELCAPPRAPPDHHPCLAPAPRLSRSQGAAWRSRLALHHPQHPNSIKTRQAQSITNPKHVKPKACSDPCMSHPTVQPHPVPPRPAPWRCTLALYPGAVPWRCALALYPGAVPWSACACGVGGGSSVASGTGGAAATYPNPNPNPGRAGGAQLTKWRGLEDGTHCMYGVLPFLGPCVVVYTFLIESLPRCIELRLGNTDCFRLLSRTKQPRWLDLCKPTLWR